MDIRSDDTADLSLDQLVELERRAAQQADDLDDERRPDDAIVLPWWQHPVNIVTMVLASAIIAAMVGWMVGDATSRVDHNDVDTGFLQDMREHHEQAVLMSFVYRTRPDVDPGLNAIARSIIVGQQLEIGRMIQMLRDFGETESREDDVAMLWMGMSAEPGQMPGMASDDELDELSRLDGRDADELFVELMTAHHVGGIEMAEFAAEQAKSEEVREMAAAMAGAQRGEIVEMIEVLG